MTRIVADTNIYISGLFWPGLNRLILNLARHEVLSLACSQSVVKELDRTLRGKKFSLSDDQINTIISDLLSYTTPVQEPPFSHPRLRDPKDHFICSLAVKSKASYLVTGDNDLLVLKRVGNAEIVTTREFLTREFLELLEAYDGNFPPMAQEEPAVYSTGAPPDRPRRSKKERKHAIIQ